MTTWNPRANDLFLQARELSTGEARQHYLDAACQGDAALRAEVESLLEAGARAGSFLESPAAAILATIDDPIHERPGTIIGPYKLMEQIGEGGMGLVFVAEQQQPIRRKVALKVIKPGMDTRAVVARFEAERQALALMDHPNIARVLDAGATATGRPYFVMELVKGVPITDYCDQNQVPIRKRLGLFVHVCQAVQHAHQKGVIHRDIKPSNVLVMSHDGVPVVKVIDFGVAKAIGQDLTDKTVYTQLSQLIGTPLYMSPEQAGQSGLDVDTRTDIYGLGVLLYELLTGTTPFDQERLREVGYDEMRRIIREEEPPRPSTRLSTLGQAATTVSANRKSEPRKLRQLLRGELDWIVMKCLEKDRNRRYETASALSADAERYRHNEPVQACPPSRWYRLRKFAWRYRAALTTAALVLFVLVAGVVFSTWQAIRAGQAEARANLKRDEAEANFRKACQAVDDQFTLVSQSKLFDTPGLQNLRKYLLESALSYYQDFLRQRPEDPVLQAEIAAAYFRLAQIYHNLDSGLSTDALLAFERGLAIVERLLEEHGDDTTLYRRLAGFVKGGRLVHSVYSGRGPGADPLVAIGLFERAARVWEHFVRNDPGLVGFQFDLAGLHYFSCEVQAEAGRPADALASARKAFALREQIARENPRVLEYRAELAHTHDLLAWQLKQVGPPNEVEKHYRQALELRQQLVAECPAVPEYRAALALSHDYLGSWLAENGRLPEAEAICLEGLSVWESLATEFTNLPYFRGLFATCHDNLGDVLRRTGRTEKAEQTYRRALALWEKLAADFPTIAGYREKRTLSSFSLCLLLAVNGRRHEAEPFYRKVREFKPESAGEHNQLAWLLVTHRDSQFRDPSRAVDLASKAVELGAQRWDYWNTLGVAHYRASHCREAIAALEKSMQLANGQDESFNTLFLAMAYWDLGNKDEARRWYEQSVSGMNQRQCMNPELCRFRAEAAALLGINDQPKAKDKEKFRAVPPGP